MILVCLLPLFWIEIWRTRGERAQNEINICLVTIMLKIILVHRRKRLLV